MLLNCAGEGSGPSCEAESGTARELQVQEATPTGGHFSPTRSERIDKMYKEVRTCAATYKKLAKASSALQVVLSKREQTPSAQALAVALHVNALLQVHDYAQNLKECERQLKQLEIASVGTQSIWNEICQVLLTIENTPVS